MTRISQQRVSDMLLMLMLRPHRLAMILIWRVLGKKLRARCKLETAISGLPFAMERNMASFGTKDLLLLATPEASAYGIRMCVHLHLSDDDDLCWANKAIKSITTQSCAPFRVFITANAEVAIDQIEGDRFSVLPNTYMSRIDGIAAAMAEAQTLGCDWLVPCTRGSTLTPNALAGYEAHVISHAREARANVIYGDTREASKGLFGPTRRTYWLKPKWDPRMYLSQDYVTQGCALAIEPALHALDAGAPQRPSNLYELVLSMSERGVIEHCARVVSQGEPESWCRNGRDREASVQAYVGGKASIDSGPFGTIQVRWPLPEPLPTVSIIVATRDKVDLLRTCVEGVLEATDYPALDLIIADNESIEPDTLAYMEAVSADPRVQVVRWPHPFNYSAINNFAARHAKGEYLCLLNNDIELIEPDWLIEMVREAVQPGVGAVGARLLYPDRSIQHAGVAIGIGNAAGHAHRGLPEGEPGYFAQTLIARGASAVTAACLVVSRAHFDQIGGLDEKNFAVAYNDVDFCLRLQAQGLMNIYAPLATLIHHESKSRGLDFAPEHLERYMRELKVFQERWDAKTAVDPWHHPLLARGREEYANG